MVLGASGNQIGPGNQVSHNIGAGVEISGKGASGNRIVANSIHDNGGKGISLVSGANGGIQAPTITSATTVAGTATISGAITASPGDYYVELFSNSSCDTPASGEGESYVIFVGVNVPADGTAEFTGTMAGTPVGTPVTVTLTRATAPTDTSEFSPCATTSPGSGTVQIEPEADAFVAKGAPTTNFGSLDYADVYGGANPSCVLANGRSYTLMRFDLSSIPDDVPITNARLETTTRAGYAQDGDPAHWALFIPNDTWDESVVTWNNRPADGLTTEGDPAYDGGPDIRQSSLSFGAADVWRNGCGVDPDPAGNQTKVFPSTTDGLPRTVAEAREASSPSSRPSVQRRRKVVPRAVDAELPGRLRRQRHVLLGPLLHARGHGSGGAASARRHLRDAATDRHRSHHHRPGDDGCRRGLGAARRHPAGSSCHTAVERNPGGAR